LGMPDLVGTDIRVSKSGISSLAECMVLLRYAELRSRLYHLVSLFKMRDGAVDPTIREFAITDAGIVVGQPFEAVLGGMARDAADGAPAALSENDNRGLLGGGAGRSG